MFGGAAVLRGNCMALDSTPYGVSAESYLSVADADLLAAGLGLTSWAAKTTQEKEIALRVGTKDIDLHRFHDPVRYQWNQALKFPRARDLGLIPREIKWALIYQAEWVAVAGETDRKQWDGAQAAPLGQTGNTSPLCPRAMNALAQFISRVGGYA